MPRKKQKANAKREKRPNAYGLTPKQEAFVQEYLIDLNAAAAYRRAKYKVSSDEAASAHGARLVANGKVQAAIQDAMEKRKARMQLSADEVLARWAAIADADPNELIEIRRTCCRHCHGTNFQYQRTAGEMERATAAWQDLAAKAEAAGAPAPPQLNATGGIGYDARKDPHPQCPECFGEGVATPFPKDTRKLSESARRLYAGVKVTKDGIEIKMHDQAAALLNVAKHLGMLIDKHKHEVGGKDGAPVPITIIRFDEHEHDGPESDDKPKQEPV